MNEVKVLKNLIEKTKKLNASWMEVLRSIPNKDVEKEADNKTAQLDKAA